MRLRVAATSLNAADWHMLRGKPLPVRFTTGGLRRPRRTILGCDVAGTVEAVHEGVTSLEPGDLVCGDLSGVGGGACAQFICAPAELLVAVPPGLSLTDAASLPMAGVTALQALRKGGCDQASVYWSTELVVAWAVSPCSWPRLRALG